MLPNLLREFSRHWLLKALVSKRENCRSLLSNKPLTATDTLRGLVYKQWNAAQILSNVLVFIANSDVPLLAQLDWKVLPKYLERAVSCNNYRACF